MADDPATRLVLIRHGESKATVNRVVGGPRSCDGLSPHGRLQCARLAERLAATGELYGARLYASHYRRAVETAELLAAAIGDPPVVVDADFGEHEPGPECDGLTFDEFLERYGMPDWESDPFAVTFPGGETLAEMQFRIGRAVHRILGQHAGEVVVVCCHGGVVNAVMRQALHTAGTGGFDLFTENTSLTELLHVRPGRWRLLRYNDAAHLAGQRPGTG